MTADSKTLVVTHVISGDLWAGAEVQVYNLCRALKASDQVAPTVVTFNEGILYNKLKELAIPVSLADEKKLGPLAIARSIAAHCREQGSKIVHTHGFKENVLGVLGKEFAGVKISVRTVHGNPENVFSIRRPHKWLIEKMDTFLGRTRQQAVIAVSTQLQESLNRMFPGQVHKIFNFVDVEEIRRQWPVKARDPLEKPLIGIVGRLVPVKRVDIFIQTIALLNQQGFECTGVVIGSGPLDKELKELADDLNIRNHIEFKGFVDPSLEELRKLDILLMTSDHEGLPMTLLEAMSLGIKIIAHHVGGIPEVLDSGAAGILVTDHTPRGYAESITRCSESSRLLADQTSSNPHDVLFRKFNIDKNTKRYSDIYLNLTDEIRGPI
ncbi:glycosyltransferase family 4 protein [Marinobacter halophilus]|uniref:Glycosyltransferase family 1 protein n=1 Tax=Marinobacter halophilus TaxID=1323740 RepID=A0A2T1K8I7_9GAMM|nr:glycosyltransferase family 4 protein [Marinobacter halophilus]PSF06461.1 hypothetical protein C7H08_15245 [Marinobacter halophilus]GGC72801.1 glycosyl transferase family 1 [Marinobacter halophilus]